MRRTRLICLCDLKGIGGSGGMSAPSVRHTLKVCITIKLLRRRGANKNAYRGGGIVNSFNMTLLTRPKESIAQKRFFGINVMG